MNVRTVTGRRTGVTRPGRTPSPLRAGWVCLWVVSTCAVSTAVADVTIVSNGQPNATIVVAADADEVVIDAVADLQACLQKMSGATLPITNTTPTSGNIIFVGRVPEVDMFFPDLDSMDLGPDGFVIKAAANLIFITGQSDGHNSNYHPRIDCGTPNAVYAFLETLGCRWYLPGDDGEVVPSVSTIVVPEQDVVSKPDFDGRWVGSGAAEDMGEPLLSEYMTWLGRMRTSPNAHHEGHQMSSLVPRSLFATHPEYFALIDGVRVNNARVCMGNPDVVTTATNKLIPFLSQLPWRSYPAGQYDAYGWCQDAYCYAQYGEETFVYGTREQGRAIGFTPTNMALPNVANCNLMFINEIARRVEAGHPNTFITYYAVYVTPGFPEVIPRDNVMPMITHIYPNGDAWRQRAEKWANISRQLYYLSYVGYRVALPRFNIVDDLRWCHQHKGRAVTLYVVEYSPLNLLTAYLSSRGLWDTGVSAADVLSEFYTRISQLASAALV